MKIIHSAKGAEVRALKGEKYLISIGDQDTKLSFSNGMTVEALQAIIDDRPKPKEAAKPARKTAKKGKK